MLVFIESPHQINYQIALQGHISPSYKTEWCVIAKAFSFSTRDSTRSRDRQSIFSHCRAVIVENTRILLPMWLRRVSTHTHTHPPPPTHPHPPRTRPLFSFFSLLNGSTGSGSEWGTDGPSDARPRGEKLLRISVSYLPRNRLFPSPFFLPPLTVLCES